MSEYIVGLTGGIASGKTTVSDYFKHLGVDIIDADVIAREVVAPGTAGLQAIKEKFGSQVLLENGELNRVKLREIVFANNNDKDWLNALLHPIIRNEMQKQTKEAHSAYCILSVPLLIENGLDEMVNRTLVVDIDEATQLQRALTRDGSSEQTIKGIMSAQASRESRLSKADDVIHNNKDIKWLQQQVDILHKKYLENTNVAH